MDYGRRSSRQCGIEENPINQAHTNVVNDEQY